MPGSSCSALKQPGQRALSGIALNVSLAPLHVLFFHPLPTVPSAPIVPPPPHCAVCRYTSSWLAAEKARDGEWWKDTLSLLRRQLDEAASMAIGASAASPQTADRQKPAAGAAAGKRKQQRRQHHAAAAAAAAGDEEQQGSGETDGEEATGHDVAAAKLAAVQLAADVEDAELEAKEKQVRELPRKPGVQQGLPGSDAWSPQHC